MAERLFHAVRTGFAGQGKPDPYAQAESCVPGFIHRKVIILPSRDRQSVDRTERICEIKLSVIQRCLRDVRIPLISMEVQ